MLRRRIPEIMDGAGIAESDHAHALRSLSRVNRLFGIDRRLCRRLGALGPVDPSVLDLGCGGGGFLAYVADRRRTGPVGFLLGIDRAEFALRCARDWHQGNIRWVSADAYRLPLADNSIDVVTCSLFLHHFDPAGAVAILREAARVARHGIIVDDLVRSRLAWVLTWVMTRILSRSWIFHSDGPQSVRAAFTLAELSDLARAAGLENAIIRRRFPFRAMLTWRRTN